MWVIIPLLFLFLVGAYVIRWRNSGAVVDVDIDMRSRRGQMICSGLLTAEDFVHACSSAAGVRGLRVDTEMVPFPILNKCIVSVTAPGAYTFAIIVDAFDSTELARARFQSRTKGVVDGLIDAPGNVLGFGERSAYHTTYGGPELDLLRDHVYVEITPSGGSLCTTPEQFMRLGQLIYERIARLPVHRL